jgi:ABC-type transport system involved in cytochrome bd biosynthesis fused ATPase/permease subunit
VHSVSSSPELLQGSLRRALLMGCDTRPEDATLEHLARDVGLGPLLDRLGGLDGTVLEGGKNLTHTERLALGIVRIKLLPPKLLLLGLEVDDGLRMRLRGHLPKRGATILRLGGAERYTSSAA